MCVRVCVSQQAALSACIFLFHDQPGLHGNKRKKCVQDLLKLCIIYYPDLENPITVFLTVIFHESLDKTCSLPMRQWTFYVQYTTSSYRDRKKACGSDVKNSFSTCFT